MKKIGVFGGTDCSTEAKYYANILADEIIKSGNVLVTGGVGGVGAATISGALDAGIKREERCKRIIQILPSWGHPRHEHETIKGLLIKEGKDWFDRQRVLVDFVDCGVSISGGGGTANEIKLMKESKKPFIVVAGEGASDDASDGRYNQKNHNQKELIKELLKGVEKK